MEEILALRKSKVPWEYGEEIDWERLPKEVKVLVFDALDSLESFKALRVVSKRYWKASTGCARWNPTFQASVNAGKAKADAAFESLKRERRMRFYRPFVKHKCCCLIHVILATLCLALLVFGTVFLPLGFTPSYYEGAVDWRESVCLLDRDSSGNAIWSLQSYGCSSRSVFSVNQGFAASINASSSDLRCPGTALFVAENNSSVAWILSVTTALPCVDTSPNTNGIVPKYPPSISAAGLFVLNSKISSNWTFPPKKENVWIGVGFFAGFLVLAVYLGSIFLAFTTRERWGTERKPDPPSVDHSD